VNGASVEVSFEIFRISSRSNFLLNTASALCAMAETRGFLSSRLLKF
jgi:hypothetical protein